MQLGRGEDFPGQLARPFRAQPFLQIQTQALPLGATGDNRSSLAGAVADRAHCAGWPDGRAVFVTPGRPRLAQQAQGFAGTQAPGQVLALAFAHARYGGDAAARRILGLPAGGVELQAQQVRARHCQRGGPGGIEGLQKAGRG